jgi:short-subunit dehydrogenase
MLRDAAWLSGDRMPNVLTLTAARVAQIGYDGFMNGRRVVVAGIGNRVTALLLRIVPHALLLRLLGWGTRPAAGPS